MSAENELAVFPMANGEIWIAKRRCGDTFPECWGEVTDVIVKCATYEDAAAQFAAVSDRRSPRYVYTEYGGDMPSR